MNIHKHARQETGRLPLLAGRMEAAWPATLTVLGAWWPECLSWHRAFPSSPKAQRSPPFL